MRTGVNIRKRKDGRYEARYPKGRDAAGKLLYGYCYGHSFEEAREKRDRIMAQRPREMNLLILGAGGHGEIIRELAQSLGVFRKIGFLDDDLKNPLAMGRCDDCLRYLEEYPIAIPSVGDQKLRMQWLAISPVMKEMLYTGTAGLLGLMTILTLAMRGWPLLRSITVSVSTAALAAVFFAGLHSCCLIPGLLSIAMSVLLGSMVWASCILIVKSKALLLHKEFQT